MSGVAGVGILYLIARSIQIDCSYCILEGNAIPLNICFSRSSPSDPYKSYKYLCQNDDGVYRIDYTNNNCDNYNIYNMNIYPIYNLPRYGCPSNFDDSGELDVPLQTICSSNEYTIIEKYNDFLKIYESKGIILNKCISYSTQSADVSKYTQCEYDKNTGKPLLISWKFNDLSCTSIDTVIKYTINDPYEYPNTYLTSIQCPICNHANLSYNIYNQSQPNIRSNYVILNDDTYTFPQPLDICNIFQNSRDEMYGSYKYFCLHGIVHKAIWTDTTNCYGLYTYISSLNNILDYNCDNYRNNIFLYSEAIQPSYIKLTRYHTLSTSNGGVTGDPDNYDEITYITDYCIKQNDAVYIIIECQSSFMTIHYYSDSECTDEISECMDYGDQIIVIHKMIYILK